MTRTILSIGCVVLMAACQSDSILNADATVLIETSQSHYAPGDELVVTITNTSIRPILLNACVYYLQRQLPDGSWDSVSGVMCAPPAQAFTTISPGQQHRESHATALTSETGNYRFLFDLRANSGRRLSIAARTSETFRIE